MASNALAAKQGALFAHQGRNALGDGAHRGGMPLFMVADQPLLGFELGNGAGHRNDGWSDLDDAQSIRALQIALDLGASLFDTADAYGTGHSERVLGVALKSRRDEAIIATKFGFTYDEAKRALLSIDVTPRYIDWANGQSLKRLGVDQINLYQIHPGDLTETQADTAAETLEKLVEAGRIWARWKKALCRRR